jgi:hypothetical protein
MASKRSQVQSNLPTITANQPVARVIDTFAPTAAPAQTKTNTEAILKTLVNFGQTQSAKINAKRRAKQEAQEQAEKDLIQQRFMEDPDQFAEDLRLGKFKGLTSPAQLLAGEHMGTRLAREYNVFLREEYAKSGLDKSDDANAFFEFENGMRTQFIRDKGDAFTKQGVTAGFTKNFRQYIQALDSTHTATANTNLKTNQETAFKDTIYTSIDGVLSGSLSAQDFGNSIRASQNDAKLGYNFDNNTANTFTVDALISYSETSEGLTYQQRRDVLKLGNFIQTSPGSNLSGTREAGFKIGKALAAIDAEEERAIDRETKVYRDRKLVVTDDITTKFQAALLADPEVDLDNVLTGNDLALAKEFYPGYLKDFAVLQNFFQTEATEPLEGTEIITLRQRLSGATSREDGMKQLNSMVANGELKGDATVFGTLFSQVQSIPLEKDAKEPKPFSTDAYFRLRYSQLGGVVTDTGTFVATEKLPEPVNRRLVHFSNAFIEEYLSPEYATMTEAEKHAKVLELFNEASNIQ